MAPEVKNDYGYIVINIAGPKKNIKATKIELPLPYQVYDKKKIALMPVSVVVDTVMLPVYLFLIVFEKGYM